MPLGFRLLATAMLFLSACSATHHYSFVEPTGLDSATIHGLWLRNSATVWEGYSLMAVDESFISSGLSGYQSTEKTRVAPGLHTFTIRAYFNRGLGTGPYEAVIPIDATLKPSVAYQIQGNISAKGVSVWLEEAATKTRISEVVTPVIANGRATSHITIRRNNNTGSVPMFILCLS